MIRTNHTSNRIFIIIIALLLIANIATLAMLLSNKSGHREDHKSVMRGYLKNEIGFSDLQMLRFDSIKKLQHQQSKDIFEAMKLKKRENLKQLGMQGFSDSAVNAAADGAAVEQRKAEFQFLHHLKNVRNLCTPAQQAVFDTGFYKVMTKPSAGFNKKEK